MISSSDRLYVGAGDATVGTLGRSDEHPRDTVFTYNPSAGLKYFGLLYEKLCRERRHLAGTRV